MSATSRKNNNLLPRHIIFVRTTPGMEFYAVDYAPQRWVKSITKNGSLKYTTDPRMARRFRTQAEAAKVCERYARSQIIELVTDTLRWTDPTDDCGFTYFGYFDGKTGLNHDLWTGRPVELPAHLVRIREIMGRK